MVGYLTVIPKIGNTCPMKHESNMTSKGQVTVPKDIRDALGLLAGKPVRFEIDDDGNARIFKADPDRQKQQSIDKFLNNLNEVRAKYKPHADFAGMDGLEYQRFMRGDGPEV